MAMWRVEELLRKTTAALNAAGVPYAVVGGNAVAAWVATVNPDKVRATKDVDILAKRCDLDKMTDALFAVGMIREEVMGVTLFVDRNDPSPSRGIHVIIANELIRPRYAHPAPDVTRIDKTIAEYPVVDLPSLLVMKLQSGRHIDLAHIVDLKGVGLITSALVDQLPDDMRERLKAVQEPDTH